MAENLVQFFAAHNHHPAHRVLILGAGGVLSTVKNGAQKIPVGNFGGIVADGVSVLEQVEEGVFGIIGVEGFFGHIVVANGLGGAGGGAVKTVEAGVGGGFDSAFPLTENGGGTGGDTGAAVDAETLVNGKRHTGYSLQEKIRYC
jgi:hypothetical protein